MAAIASPAFAEDARRFEIPQQSLIAALEAFGKQGDKEILFSRSAAEGRATSGVIGEYEPAQALSMLLDGSGLRYRQVNANTYVVEAADPQSGGAAGDGADAGTVEALIVTAQKREEDIQDVPIAISAFTQEDLTRSQVAGGPDLITQVPNMTFTKTNFSSYSVQIRGIGTQAISATTDPAVAVAFNNTPFTRNRFFEQEFYDLQRVEVLRGPQGTLYGRNATAGVVNIISNKPKFIAEAKVSGDVSNYDSSRLEGMVNIPLVEDKVALRLAGAWTKRQGYATNEITDEQIDGRDLWSTRLSLRFAPTDTIDANLIWEHFEEDDDRLRSGKQLCKRHIPTQLGPYPLSYTGGFSGSQEPLFMSVLSQGCERESLYSPEAFQAPVGYAVPYYQALSAIGLPVPSTFPPFDPYLSTEQSTDLRVIESTVEPEYRAKTDIFEFQFNIDLSDSLTLASETAYSSDSVFSTQDFNRFSTAPGAWASTGGGTPELFARDVLNINSAGFAEFCDPQIGCADRLVAVDLSTAEARQFSQEFRLSSDFEGPFNFSLGANFMRADSEDKYYVFINSLTLIAQRHLFNPGMPNYVPGVSTNSECLLTGPVLPDPEGVYTVAGCVYIDPNPIGALNDLGHNYFLSKNPYKLISYAVFGEAYYNITDNLKVTAGLRWTVDKKEAPRIPSWILGSGTVGYPVDAVEEQEWREPTGRLTVDWKPDLAFTDETMVYASYAHGYKAGGANPPLPGLVVYSQRPEELNAAQRDSAAHPKTFDAEFVEALEIGAKNTFLDGRLTANFAAFYYDYENYQISEIVDRSALNRNFDAEVWGLEIEADWRPLENLKFGFKGGYQKTRIGDGEQAIDLMDRTAGNPDWVVYRPFPTYPSNCIIPVYVMVGDTGPVAPGNVAGGSGGACELAYLLGLDPITGLEYVADPTIGNGPGANFKLSRFSNYPGFDPSTAPNNGEGFFKDLSGNELPNAPNYTATITADYTLPLPNDWLATLHTDLHWQSESWWRIFNDHEFNRLDEYFTMNLAAIFTNEERGWHVMAYIKNVTDETAITGAFLNSDDTMLTTNLFLTEPRLYGLRVTKSWTGGGWFDGFAARREGPFPVTVELGGQVQRHDAPNEAFRPSFSDAFRPEIDIFGQGQNDDLDWGDGREVKVTWRPGAGPWHVSGAVRYGRTNGPRSYHHAEDETAEVCGFPAFLAFLCPIYEQYYGNDPYISRTDWAHTTASQREEHDIIDFAVGRDLGIGGLHRSSVEVGLRRATFESSTHADFDGTPDWFIRPGWAFPPFPRATRTRYTAAFDMQREFEGAGPIVSWDASLALLGGEDNGRVTLDWSLSGGALFGKQDTVLQGEERTALYSGDPRGGWRPPVGTPVETAVSPPPRSDDVTVPVAAASLGLAYDIGRIKLGAGYRWERYFDVLDAGFEEKQDTDRTIDGPYFKIAVGFGG